jgi:Fe/S biogenesis protein NfuA
VKRVIEEEVRPSIQTHGGDIDFLGVENGTVKVNLSGNCQHCMISTVTLYEGVERMLKEKFPEVERVVDEGLADMDPFEEEG